MDAITYLFLKFGQMFLEAFILFLQCPLFLIEFMGLRR